MARKGSRRTIEALKWSLLGPVAARLFTDGEPPRRGPRNAPARSAPLSDAQHWRAIDASLQRMLALKECEQKLQQSRGGLPHA